MTLTVAVVGGGISGTLTVLQLVKQSRVAVSIIWFDSQNKFCKGYAYTTFDEQHLLNVRAANMSVFADEPFHFTDWLKQYHSNYTPSDFVPRKLYGEYVLDTFEKLKHTNPLVSISQISEEVKSINKIDTNFHVTANKTYLAKKVILAFGNFLPAHPLSLSKEFITSKNYFQNPFNVKLTNNLQKIKNITIIGSGLTMLDVIVSLSHYNYKGSINVISPHAYIPQIHPEISLPSVNSFINNDKTYTLNELVSLVNKELKKAKKEHLNLHSVIDLMRPHVQRIWLKFSLKEKQQFLRHLRHKWGVARHRAPLQSMTVFSNLKASHQLTLLKGRIFDIKTTEMGFELHYSNSTNHQLTLKTDIIVNCTGPECNYSKLTSPLIQSLLKNGDISPDSLNYGLNARKDGQLKPNMFTLGPPLKGILWESVAVPEIRVQAQELAAKIICD